MKNTFILIALVMLVSCSRNEDRVESYTAPKAPAAPVAQMPGQAPGQVPGMMPGMGGAAPAGQVPGMMPGMAGAVPAPHGAGGPPAFSWKTPADWTPGPTSQFRIGSFEIPGAGAEKFTATIIVLGGEGGALVENVNRWREQINLPRQTSQQILASAKKDKGALGAFTWFDINEKANPKSAMLTAILKSGEDSVFVKLVASPDVIAKNRTKFLELCRSLKKNSDPHAGMAK